MPISIPLSLPPFPICFPVQLKDLPEQYEDAADEEGVGAHRGGHGGGDSGAAMLTHH